MAQKSQKKIPFSNYTECILIQVITSVFYLGPLHEIDLLKKKFLHLNVSISRHISLLPLINIQHSYLSRQSIPQLKNHPTICFEIVKQKWLKRYVWFCDSYFIENNLFHISRKLLSYCQQMYSLLIFGENNKRMEREKRDFLTNQRLLYILSSIGQLIHPTLSINVHKYTLRSDK